jgi:hypothetical protein
MDIYSTSRNSSFRTIWLITPTQMSSEGQESWKQIDTGKFFPKKIQKQQQQNDPASAAYAPTIHGKYMQFLSP